MKKLHWGVMGTADIAKTATIPSLRAADNARLYAIAGRSMEKAQSFRERFGFERAYGSYDELLADANVEAVYIPLPNDLHCPWAIKAMEAGKHVLCEKPLAISEEQEIKMFDCARKNGVLLMEGFAYLHSPIVQAIKQEVESGVIGDIRYLESAFLGGIRPDTDIRLRRETFGGSMYDLGCYPLSMALWMLDGEITKVHAAAEFTEKKIDLYSTALLTFESGAVASLTCGMALEEGRRDGLSIFGTKGEIISPVAFNQPGKIEYTVIAGGRAQTKAVMAPGNYQLEMEQFGRCVLDGEKPHISREFSLRTAREMDRILARMGY